MPVIFAALYYWHECENHIVLWTAAGLIFAAGLALRLWSQQHLHFRLRMPEALTTCGPYSLFRNPIYIGNTLICVSLTVASEILWIVPITLVTCAAVYSLAVRHEEQRLLTKYGAEYAAYQQQVPRWIPKLSRGFRPSWSRNYLRASMKVEAYNLLFIIPFVLKEMFEK